MREIIEGNTLKKISTPEDLKKLSEVELEELCGDLRKYIIDVLSENPGHLASSLGVVELTVALHYLFNIPEDSLVWDVGHQAYAHKVLTERKEAFKNIRKLNGLSGFPRRDESKYDCFGAGHASTSISASLGMAIADKIEGKDDHFHIAVIGDGSMTGGMAFEALNHAGATNANVLIILNDNGISIDKGVGALGQYLTRITTSRTYNRVKNRVWNTLGGNDNQYNTHRSFWRKFLSYSKSLFSGKSNFFEALNIRYFGPLDGHDLPKLIKTIESLKKIQGPKLLHIVTKKGKGLSAAENNPTIYHAPGIFNAKTGAIEKKQPKTAEPKKYSDIAGKTILELQKKYSNVACITPAMLSGSGLNEVMKTFPERTFDVGIAEEHAVTFSAGLATRGIKPYCCIYSSFLQRGFDQVIHDVALQKLPVVFCIDRAGLVGEDGATHHGVFDLAYLNIVPNIIVGAPCNEIEMQDMMFTAYNTNLPFAIRYPRGKGVVATPLPEMKPVQIGKGEEINKGENIAIVSLGTIGNNAIEAVDSLKEEGINIGLYNMRFLKPLDTELLDNIAKKYKKIITIEDGVKIGGFGWSVKDYLTKNNSLESIVCLGVEDKFIEQGSVKELQKLCGLDTDSIIAQVRRLL